ncbi:MAG: efflux RND transporter permease subunit, partial [Planctomycetota bacterium]
VTTLVASLIVAIWFIPMLASRTGFRLRDGVGMEHPLGRLAGRIRPATFLLRVALPIAVLLAVLVAGVVGYSAWRAEETLDPRKKVDLMSVAIATLWTGGACMVVPLLIALLKVRWRHVPDQKESLATIWSSFRAFKDSLNGRPHVLLALVLPYLIPRLALSFLLELIGWSLVWAIRFVAGILLGLVKLTDLVRRLFPKRKAPKAERNENGIYPRSLRWALQHPAAMLFVALACLGLTYTVGRQLQSELLPEVYQGEFSFEVALPVGTPLEETVDVLSDVEETILGRLDDLGVDTLLVTYGFDASNLKRSDEGEHSAVFKFLLAKSDNPRQAEERVVKELRTIFQNVPDLDTRVTRPVLFSSKKPIVVQINGEDLSELKQFSDRATVLLSESPELADVEPTLRSGAPEVEIQYDRQQMIRHGLNIETVAQQVRDMVKGAEATRLNRRDRRVPIVVRLQGEDREQVADVGKLIINPGAEVPIPLEAIASLSVGEGPSEIRRIDGKRVTLVEANIGGRSLGAGVDTAKSTLENNLAWPSYMGFEITGQNKEWERSRGSLYLALGLSLFLVYVVMASQFESLIQPLVIMLTIPMAFFGTVLGLRMLGMNISVVVFLGMIMLAGIVVNNAIVLVDYTNALRARGLALKDAIVQAGQVRLRPILMTTATTVLGLLPMALGIGNGAEIRTPMAITVVFGLLTSTFLTLLIIPTFYYLVAALTDKFFASDVEFEG